ncbi:MAG: aspartate carbamoyltransferase catalytic subunit [Limnochordales bacterium]|nr:aspartate carbamoyltransferase catalytic subunit [Limnochordales bacterium]
MGLQRKDLLGLEHLTRAEIELILETARPMLAVLGRPVKKYPTLRGRIMVNLFYESSTRTRTSFELAAKALSADVVNIAVATSAVVKGESLVDTARTLEALGADWIVLRHSSSGAPHLLARQVRAGVINAGDGLHEHPTQGLLDLFTLLRRKGRIEGLRVGIVGDVLHSRVARSDIWGLTRLGAQVVLIGPPTLVPPGIEKLFPGVEVSYNLREVLPSLDAVQVLRLQLERQKRGLFPSVEEYSRFYRLDSERLRDWRAKPDLVVMHPGPANLGVEISEELANSPQSAIREQVQNGVAVRMAVLYLLAGGRTEE